jgi:hypothetical protein
MTESLVIVNKKSNKWQNLFAAFLQKQAAYFVNDVLWGLSLELR